jgi:8-oxo-dGTP diphosphatase
MIQRIGEPVRRGIRYRPRPGAYAVLEKNGEVLLTFQAEPQPEIQLPGGGIDPGETTLMALHREVREETGWQITGPRRLGVFRRFTYMEEYDFWAEKICHVYFAKPTRMQSAPTEVGHFPIWATPERAIELVDNEGDRLFLRRYFGR